MPAPATTTGVGPDDLESRADAFVRRFFSDARNATPLNVFLALYRARHSGVASPGAGEAPVGAWADVAAELRRASEAEATEGRR